MILLAALVILLGSAPDDPDLVPSLGGDARIVPGDPAWGASTDPKQQPPRRDLGVDHDRCRAGTLAIRAPEIIQHGGQDPVASLLPSRRGIPIRNHSWEPKT